MTILVISKKISIKKKFKSAAPIPMPHMLHFRQMPCDWKANFYPFEKSFPNVKVFPSIAVDVWGHNRSIGASEF